jgi:four helix bundle protein
MTEFNTPWMPAKDQSKRYDLEDRTFEFAKATRAFVKRLPRRIANAEDAKQLIRASGSIGANYIEAKTL